MDHLNWGPPQLHGPRNLLPVAAFVGIESLVDQRLGNVGTIEIGGVDEVHARRPQVPQGPDDLGSLPVARRKLGP